MESKDVGENHLSLLCNKNQIRRDLSWSRRNQSLKINSMTSKETLRETWRPEICSCYLQKWFLYVLYDVRTLYLIGELVWLINLVLKFELLLLSPLFSEWNLTCQHGVLNIVYKEPYGSQLKGGTPNHWNISANKEP